MIVTNQDTLLQLRLEQERKEKKKQKEKVRECINPSVTIGDPYLYFLHTIWGKLTSCKDVFARVVLTI